MSQNYSYHVSLIVTFLGMWDKNPIKSLLVSNCASLLFHEYLNIYVVHNRANFVIKLHFNFCVSFQTFKFCRTVDRADHYSHRQNYNHEKCTGRGLNGFILNQLALLFSRQILNCSQIFSSLFYNNSSLMF